ncbi:MAG: FAD-dependent oxidoreductase [Alphaproteobacteria bacterium]|nr:FAD-dependent oxidoreductase [Alphaproteobacteria bacterium]MDY4690231.1 FAD-dependent oxidoreductase [Alphaproteobacteria bacterium]
MSNNVILGAGIAGISAAYHLKQKGENSVIFEKDNDWGGLCGFFEIDGFRFDRFVHFTFAKDEKIAELFAKSSPLYAHPPVSYNYWRGCWLKHPAQNNLAPLPIEEKVKIIDSFVNRPRKDVAEISDYAEWLRVQYGDYFAENFPFAYTRKYWGVEANQLETKWVGNRLHVSPLPEVLRGAFAEQQENFYYTKFMNYPKKGGFRSIMNECRKGLDIRLNKKAVRIDTAAKQVEFADGTVENYDNLISSLPLPEIIKMISDVPENVQNAAKQLRWTCGYQVSLGFNRPDVAKYLWFYIYDEDVPPARVYSPNLKSPDNAPDGCSSLQAEIFFANGAKVVDKNIILQKTVEKLKEICQFNDSDVVVKDIRFEPYANIIFTPEIYESRKVVREWLQAQGIKTIGRFGEWDYLWSHQAFESGMKV